MSVADLGCFKKFERVRVEKGQSNEANMLIHTEEGGKGRESSMGDQDLDDLLKAPEREREGGLHVNLGKRKK